MKLYFAGAEKGLEMLRQLGVKRILLSYYVIRKWKPDKIEQVRRMFDDIFLGCGAYSAFTQKDTIRIEDYIDFIRKYPDWNVIASLDVIGNPGASWKNWLTMWKAGIESLPCFHIGEDFKWLKKYTDNTDDLVLGGLLPYSIIEKQIFLSKCFAQLKNYRIHLSGFHNYDLLKKFPFCSADIQLGYLLENMIIMLLKKK